MAKGDIRVSLTETGYNELRAKLKDTEPWVGAPYKRGMARIGDVGAGAARFSAPVGPTHRTANNIRAVVSKAKIPRFVRFDELAKSDQGYPYPRMLEFSPYAQSKHHAGTNKHRLWMRNAIMAVVPEIDAIFDQTADEVEKRWAE